LTFDVSAVGDGDRVSIRLNGRLSSVASHNVVTTVYAVPDVTWDESGVTWNSRPNRGTVLGAGIDHRPACCEPSGYREPNLWNTSRLFQR
jgi:hypothetical protein